MGDPTNPAPFSPAPFRRRPVVAGVSNGMHLFSERPDLDVEFVFRLQHPFPPAVTVARRLLSDHDVWVGELLEGAVADGPSSQVRALSVDAVLDLNAPQRVVAYEATARHDGVVLALGRYESPVVYPLGPAAGYSGASSAMAEALGGLIAGPWLGAADHVARAMSTYNALLAAEDVLRSRG